jgi:hypothetical protein
MDEVGLAWGLSLMAVGMAVVILLAMVSPRLEERFARTRLGRRMEAFGERVERFVLMAWRLVRPARRRGRRRA